MTWNFCQLEIGESSWFGLWTWKVGKEALRIGYGKNLITLYFDETQVLSKVIVHRCHGPLVLSQDFVRDPCGSGFGAKFTNLG